jgi:NADH-quinone oxidoreductase subunit A
MQSYIPIFMMIGVAAFLGIVFLTLQRFLGPHRPNPEKLSTYESGDAPRQFRAGNGSP